jgi:hypothetical protein
MSSAVRAVGLLLGFSLFSTPAFAGKFSCEALLIGERSAATPYLRQQAINQHNIRERQVPRPGFDDHRAEASRQQTGDAGPQALAEGLMGPGALQRDLSRPGSTVVKFNNIPGVSGADPIAVDMLEEGRAISMLIETNWNNEVSATDAWAYIPTPKVLDNGPYVFGKGTKALVVHLHGGGTPTAKAANGIGFGKEYAKSGISTLLVGMPGHGLSTRNPEGLEDFHKNAEWLLQMLEGIADPSIPKYISGHSWGAMWSVVLRRMMLVPKYRERMQAMNIVAFMPLAPPVDVSLSGDNRAKLEWERKFELEFDKYKDLIAPADFEFQKNVLANGKDSDVGGTHLSLTNLDYNTRPLTAAEEAMLPPEKVLVGHADSLYVGREKEFAQAFGDNLSVYGPGRSHKTPEDKPEQLDPTGHQLMEVFIPGTKTVRIYRELRDFVLNGPSHEPLEKQFERWANMKDEVPPETTGNNVQDVYEKVLRHWSNFFGFRELIKLPQYVTAEDVQKREFSKSQSTLDAFVKKMKPVEEEIAVLEAAVPGQLDEAALDKKKEFPFPQARKAVEALRAKLGVKGQINTPQRAQDELNFPDLTPERRAELQKFIKDIETAEADLKANFKDPIYDMAVKNLNTKWAKLLNELQVSSVLDAESKRTQYDRSVKIDKSKEWIRSDLSRLQQDLARITENHQKLFGAARTAKLTQIHTPEGVSDMRSANRELQVDRSPEYRAKLKAFIEQYPAAIEAARQTALTEARAKLAQGPFPDDLTSAADVRAKLQEVEARLDYTYIPEGHEEIGVIARQIKKLYDELEVLKSGPAKTPAQKQKEAEDKKAGKPVKDPSLAGEQITVHKLHKKRADELDKWEGYFKDGQVTSKVIQAAQQSLDTALEAYKATYLDYDTKKNDYILELYEQGQLTGHAVLNPPKAIEEARANYLFARKTYLNTRASFEKIRWVEAIKGHLTGPEEITRKAKETARTMYGDDFSQTGKPGSNSLIHLLALQEASLAKRQNDVSLKERQIEMLKSEYTARMQKANQVLPGVVYRVDLMRPLNQSKADFLAALEADPILFEGYQQAVRAWDRQLATLRSENQTKDKSSAGAY